MKSVVKYSVLLLPLFISGCATTPQVPFHKMSCAELDKKIALAEENVKTQEALQGLSSLSQGLAALGGAQPSSYSNNNHGTTISHYKTDLSRMENAYYAKGCHKKK